jgi:hypothetical protein
MAGAVRIAQVELAELLTATPQVLRAVAVETLVIEQLVDAWKLPLKSAEAPGASDAVVKTGVVPLRLFITTTLVSVMFPELRTVPVKVRSPPKVAGFTGQDWVTTIEVAVRSAHVAVAAFETLAPEQLSVPVAVATLVTEHPAGAVEVAVKLALAPGARVATVNTGVAPFRLLTTATLFNVTLPELRTVPL